MSHLTRQMARQEKAINSMSADEFVHAVDTYKKLKRNTSSAKTQTQFRVEFKEKVSTRIRNSILKQRENMSPNDKRWMTNEQIDEYAKQRANKISESMDALHDPDQVVGGYFKDNIAHMGRSDVNSYLGKSMKGNRVNQMRDSAIRQQQAGKGSGNMNISLTIKPVDKVKP